MDVTTTLKIQKSMSLIKRLPESHLYSSLDKQKAQWIVFSEHLAIRDFDRRRQTCGFIINPLSAWSGLH